MAVSFHLAGQQFTALIGGRISDFTEAVSFLVHCIDQKEVDRFWDKLRQGGQESQCGWLKHRYRL